MGVGFLDLEDANEFFKMFDKDEERKNTPIAVGKLTSIVSEGQQIKLDLLITTRVVYPNDEGDTIIRYNKNIGTCLIPFEALKNGRRGDKEEYDERKKMMDELYKKADELKNNLCLQFEGKGFPVVKGVWSA